MTSKTIVITGPTATGKTHLGVMLAKKLNGEVVSADSMQIYKHMDIGSAKPDAEEMDGVRHHMIDVVEPDEAYSVSRYVEEADKAMQDIISRGKIPIIVGGTGLYIESLLSGRDFAPQPETAQVREELSAEYDSIGGTEMLKKLSVFDPVSAERLHSNDKKRIVRAFEVYMTSGETITEHDERTRNIPPRYESCRIALTFNDRGDLYDRIDRRVDVMMERGLVSEVEKLLGMGIDERCTSMQGIGYKEIALAIKEECTLEEAVERVKMESRRYAKRQLSWLRRDKELLWINWEKEPDFNEGLQVSTKFAVISGIS